MSPVPRLQRLIEITTTDFAGTLDGSHRAAADRFLVHQNNEPSVASYVVPFERLRRQLCVWASHTEVVGELNPAVLHL